MREILKESRVSDERSLLQGPLLQGTTRACCTWPMLALNRPYGSIDTHLLQHPSSVSCLYSKFALFSVSTARGLDRLRYCSSSAVYLNKSNKVIL